MTFTEKLSRLVADRNRAAVARNAGLPPNAVSDYVNKGYTPRADTAFRLARALNVSVDWLLDDQQGWPPMWVNAPEPAPARVA
jgi:transcriptional regulator with XRE-family HTH domain